MTNTISTNHRIALFLKELGLLAPAYREFAMHCIAMAPGYVFTNCPSSSSGKYHPTNELGPDGTVRHTRKVVAVANALTTAMGLQHYRDVIVTAAIVHDLRKQGLRRKGYTVSNHPALAADLVNAVATRCPGLIPTRCAKLIAHCAGYHYGAWGTGEYAIAHLAGIAPREVLAHLRASDMSAPALAVFAADYIVSRREVGSLL